MEESNVPTDNQTDIPDGYINKQKSQEINSDLSAGLINSQVQINTPSCFTIAPNTIQVKWNACRVYQDSLISYEIRYKKLKPDSELWHTALSNEKDCQRDFSNLDKDTLYVFKVRAIFNNSEGPFSAESDPVSTSVNESESLTSLESCISKSRQEENSSNACDNESVEGEHDKYIPIVEDYLTVRHPVCFPISSDTIKVTWVPLSQLPKNFQSFEVRYKSTTETTKRWHSKFTNGKECEIDIVNLVEETKYCFKVRSIYDDVEGPFSDISDPVSTLQISLNPQLNMPGKPMAENITSTSISLKWISPVKTTGDIDCYEIKYKVRDALIKRWSSVWTKRNETNILLDELKVNTSYSIKVRPMIEGEDGPFSETVTAETTCKINSPGIPQKITSTSTQIAISWLEPDDSNDPQGSHYEVRFREQNSGTKWQSIYTDNWHNKVEVLNLKENAFYEFKVRALYGETEGTFSYPVAIISTNKASACGPVDSIKCPTVIVKSVTKDSVILTWDQSESNSSSVDFYEVRYTEIRTSKVSSTTTTGNENEIDVGGLRNETAYEFKVRAVMNGKDGTFSKPVEVKTRNSPETTPLLHCTPPVQLNRTTDSIDLQWQPTTIYHDKVLHYELRYKNNCGSKWLTTHTVGNENEISVSKLEANIEYEFKVRPIYDDEDGNFSDVNKIWTLPITDEPKALVATEVSFDCIKLQWTPSDNIQHVDSYDIRYKICPNGKWSLLTTDKTEHIVRDLLENTEYEFKVRAIYGDKEGAFSETIKTSTSRDQSLPRVFRIEKLYIKDISSNSATIVWDLPENVHNKEGYEVNYRYKSRGKWSLEKVTANNFTLQNLREASTYQCRVRVFTKGQEFKFSDVISITTTNKNIAVENEKPGSPQQEQATFNTVKIKWESPVNYHGIRYYDVLYRSSKTEDWVVNAANENRATINNLQPSTVYEFKVRAVFDNNKGDFSETTNISTGKNESPQAESNKIIIGKPEIIKKGYCHAILRWSISNLKTNDIQYHDLKYREFKGNKRGNWESVLTDDGQNEYKLQGLKPSTEYEFRVGVVFTNSTRSSLSAISDPVKTLTCEIGKIQQRNETHESVTLYWNPPEIEDDVECYETIYRERLSTAQTWQSAKTNKPEITLEGLREFTEYEIKIRCIMINGVGSFTQIKPAYKTKMRPIQKCPGQPVEIKGTSRSISISWKPSELKKIDCYEVRYREQGTKTKKWISVLTDTGATQYTIIDLKGGTDYEFKVAAIVNGETDEFSKLSQKICTKLSLARMIQLDANTEIDHGPPQRFKLPVVVKTQNRDAKTRKCQLDHKSFYLNKNCNEKTSLTQKGGFGSRVSSWFRSKPAVQNSLPITVGVKEKTIMLVGATGSGKSTLIDGMINYITDVSWEDDFRFSLIDVTQDEKKHQDDQTVSQTEWITTYRIPCIHGSNLDYTINIIDTPGFGDTRGITRDKELVAQVTKLFQAKDANGIQTLDAVCFVTQSPLARLTQAQLYIFDSILSLFGKDIESNIFVLITFADGKTPPVLDALQKAQIPFKRHFIFNNSALFEASNIDTTKELFSKMFWKMGEDSFKTFFKHLKVVEPKSLQLTADVLQTRNLLEVTIEGLQKQIRNGMIQLNTIQQEAEILKRHQSEIKCNTDFHYEVEEVVMTHINLEPGEFVTNCLQCNISCHYPCHVKADEDKKRCSAMGKTENCKICPQKCHWTKHRNASFKLEAIPQTVKKTYHELKQKFEIAQKEATSQTSVLKKVKKKFLDLRKDVYDKITGVQKCVNDLDKFALKPNPLSNLDYIDLLIAAEEHDCNYQWEDRVKLLKSFRQAAQMIHEATSGTLQPFKDTDEILRSFDID